MPEIKYVCFDIGGVANVRMPLEEVLSRGQKYFSQDFSEEKLQQMMYPTVNGRDIWREFQNGNVTSEQYIGAAFKSVNIPATIENRIFFYRLLQEWCGVPYQPVLDLVDALKKNGYHTSVLSNNNEIMYNTPSAEAMKKRVDTAISSHEIGVSKPHWDAFCVLLGRIKAEAPEQVLFVDDREKNIEAANKYGLRGFHFRSKEKGMDKALGDFVQYLKGKGVRI